jgi:putative transposase
LSKSSKAVDYFHLPRPLWRKLKKCLPERKRSKRGGRPPCPDRAVMNALWYVLWTGCQWKALHRTWFGVSASAVHARFQRWRRLGVFEKMMTFLAKHYGKRRKVKWKWQSLDSKSCPAPLGGEGTGRNPTDRGKRGSKIHLLVDKRGAPLSVIIGGANRHDKTAAVDVLVTVAVERPSKPQHLCADAAYDSADVQDFAVLEGYTPHIKPNKRRGKEPKPQGLGETIYPARRWVVERTLSWLTKRRSVRTRWSKKAANWLAFVHFACAHILFNMAVSG